MKLKVFTVLLIVVLIAKITWGMDLKGEIFIAVVGLTLGSLILMILLTPKRSAKEPPTRLQKLNPNDLSGPVIDIPGKNDPEA